MKKMITSVCGLLIILVPLVSTGQGNVTNERVLAESASGENWFLKGGSFRGDHYSPLGEINADNVNELGLAWSSEIPIPDGTATTPVQGPIYTRSMSA